MSVGYTSHIGAGCGRYTFHTLVMGVLTVASYNEIGGKSFNKIDATANCLTIYFPNALTENCCTQCMPLIHLRQRHHS